MKLASVADWVRGGLLGEYIQIIKGGLVGGKRSDHGPSLLGNGERGKWRSGYYANKRHRVSGGWLARLRSFVDFMAGLHNFRFQAGGHRDEERRAR